MDDSATDDEFVEIHPDTGDRSASSRRPDYIQAYIAEVKPRACGPLVKRLSKEVKLSSDGIDLSHLKRVKRTTTGTISPTNDDARVDEATGTGDGASPQNKRQKTNTRKDVRLQILLGAVSVLDKHFAPDQKETETTLLDILQKRYEVENIQTMAVPGRLPDSEEEWKGFHAKWPTAFFPKKTKEFRIKEQTLSGQEVEQMKLGMEMAIRDALHHSSATCSPSKFSGAIILDPTSGKVVGQASTERDVQLKCADRYNPLATSILYAIQSVSRREREYAIQQGMDSTTFQTGQYLCTGYDIYTTHEPTVFEAMAAVHARIRRMVVGLECTATTTTQQHAEKQQQHASGLVKFKVHSLPGTNHNYRAFLCRPGGKLAARCREIAGEGKTDEKRP